MSQIDLDLGEAVGPQRETSAAEGSSFKSEIRPSQIQDLLEYVQARKYKEYLLSIRLAQLRGFSGELVQFDFPVTALVGPNGGGKTTILGAAACAYSSVKPQQFFAKSGKIDETMKDWSIEYTLLDRAVNAKDTIRRTASFKSKKWNRDALQRQALLFGVSRTVPANERRELRKCASGVFEFAQDRVDQFPEAVATAVARILGKEISGFREIRIDRQGKVTLLSGQTSQGHVYSEFHFGAGESSVIRMVAQIEAAPEQALILIEEIENGLHPVATVRMVEYLLDVAWRKKIQSVFTTHSNDALRPLPSKAIWVATQRRVYQGKLDTWSLRAITGKINAQLVIFVEDQFARSWIQAILRQHGNVALDAIEIHPMQGDSTAVDITKHHNEDPAVQTPAVCFLDGDSEQPEEPEKSIFKLPGTNPERTVIDQVLAGWSSVGGKVSVALLQRYHEAEYVERQIRKAQLTNHDPHLLCAQIGERLGLIPETTVRDALTNLWAQAYPEQVTEVVAKLSDRLPVEKEPSH
jgi:energy-coupling factor transporter ATP-binding protein EcfA2